MPNTSQSPELTRAHLPKGEILAMLSKRDSIVEFAVAQSERLEQPVIQPAKPAFMQPVANAPQVIEQRAQQAFAASEQAEPVRQNLTAEPTARPELYVEPASVPEGTPSMLDESEDAHLLEARRTIAAIYNEVQAEKAAPAVNAAENPLYPSVNQMLLSNQGDYGRAA